jgi:predicted S18 family serine protease
MIGGDFSLRRNGMKRIAVLVLILLLAAAASGFALKGTPNLGIGAELTTINFDGACISRGYRSSLVSAPTSSPT